MPLALKVCENSIRSTTVFKRIWTNMPVLVSNISVFWMGLDLYAIVNAKSVS